jgi:hypothetical protein
MTKVSSWRGHNTSLPPSPSQALASSASRTRTKAEEELFLLKVGEENVERARRSGQLMARKSTFKPVDSDHFQTGTRKTLQRIRNQSRAEVGYP